jgi:histidinol-phosphate phosphatase family protein
LVKDNPLKGLILLDRDGVLNAMVVDPEHGTIDSPLHSSQVSVYAWVPEVLARLVGTGWGLAIVTNQPAAAKGKTTQENLHDVHRAVVTACESRGARILSSHLCFHREEDGCGCRKPKPGLLREAVDLNRTYAQVGVWMVGDGVTDVQAGTALGARTAFLGPRKCDACKIFQGRGLKPDFWGSSLVEFAQFLES